MEHQITPFEALKRACEVAGGQSALGRICGVGQPAVWKWLQSAKRLPAEHVLKVEAETGVSRHFLRPDIYPRELAAPPLSDHTSLCGPILSARRMAGHGNRSVTLDESAA
ncbi:transcriptional regulator [Altericroceibacterium endophyticum]|uniref:Helix-turn-helix domain-containing protein n=1 Tax=Altericroceibacterium endophyticum TaxID=1808508 RepID=A0A6I4T838_9SPHN|nr:YdaS family helix-turn-helix protein [Altericroceibacterium endophyticum]MXO66271.1 hypothetical protein [Altericroceibacterium endophyticum]